MEGRHLRRNFIKSVKLSGYLLYLLFITKDITKHNIYYIDVELKKAVLI